MERVLQYTSLIFLILTKNAKNLTPICKLTEILMKNISLRQVAKQNIFKIVNFTSDKKVNGSIIKLTITL